MHWVANKSGDGLYVHVLSAVALAQLRSDALIRDIARSSVAAEFAKVVAEDSKLVLRQRSPSGDFQFVRAWTVPSRALVEQLAEERFPDGGEVALAWLVDSPIMFVVAWDGRRSEALPFGGLGRATWAPLDEHLSRFSETHRS